jgi:hypothetical protein
MLEVRSWTACGYHLYIMRNVMVPTNPLSARDAAFKELISLMIICNVKLLKAGVYREA